MDVSAGCLDPELRERLVRGTLPDAEAAAARQHLDGCERCRRLVALLAPTLDQTAATPGGVPAAVAAATPGSQPALALPGAGTLPTPATAASSRPRRDDQPTPATLGRFRIVECLGAGGMGVVYRAFDPQLEREVALKVLHAEAGDQVGRERLLREARALARLSHRNVVAVHEVGVVADDLFLAMELVEGETLRRWLAGAARSSRQILERFVAAGRGLAAAHAAGLVHRDFKPDNVLCGEDGRVQVADFGLARRQEAADPEPGGDGGSFGAGDAVTRTGRVMGTPAYMAPEQHLARRADARSDQFAFCVALWEALAGAHPFGRGGDLRVLAERVTSGRIEPAALSALPRRMRRILGRGVAVEPEARYPTMEALLAELGRPPWWRRRAVRIGGAGVLLVAAVVAVLLLAGRGGAAVSPCGGAGDDLLGVWDAPARGRIAAGFAATGAPFAAGAYRRVAADLDTYADRWVRMHRDACEDTRVRGEVSEEMLDRRMECLAGRRRSLAAATALFAAADRDVVERAAGMVAALPPVEGCADLESLAEAVAPPADPGVRAQVAAVRQALAGVEADYMAGRFARAERGIAPVAERAGALGYPPLRGEVMLLRGKIAMAQGRSRAAEDDLFAAVAAAQSSRHDLVAAQALSLLIEVVGASAERAAEAERVVDLARAAVDRLGPSSTAGVELRLSLGNLRYHQGRYPEALVTGREALRLAVRLGNGDGVEAIAVIELIGKSLESLGQLDQAAAAYQQLVDLRGRVLGPDHPDLANTLEDLAIIACMRKRCEQAPALLERGIALLDRTVGHGHNKTVRLLGTLAGVQQQLGQLAEAEATGREALALNAAIDGGDAQASRLETNLASLLRQTGRIAEAEALHRSALERKRRLYGDDHPKVALSLLDLGMLLDESGRVPEALDTYQRAVAIFERALGPDHLDTAGARWYAARAAFTLRRLPRARELASAALAGAAAAGAGPADLADYQSLLGQIEAGLGHLARARSLLGQARDGSSDADQRAEIEQLLAGLGR